MIAKRINRINPSATLEMTAKATELKAQGLPVINLSVGEPDFNTPDNIIQAAINAMNNGSTKYTPGAGLIELREAAALKMKRDNNLEYEPNDIIISCGGKHSLYNACQVLFEKGDEVVIFSPYWVSFPDFVSVTGAKPVFVKTDSKKQFEPIMDDFLNKINTKTKAIIINSPSNPTGGVWSKEKILEIIKICKKNNLWVFSDECYEQLVYDYKYYSTAYLSNYDKIITFQSCSKTYSMTGWRIGYAAGHKKIVKAMAKLQGQSTSCPNSIAQHAAIEALSGNQEEVTIMKNAFKKRRDFIMKELLRIDKIECAVPYGAFYVFPDVSKYFNNKFKTAQDIAMYLLDKESVVSVPGDSFGAPNNIRFSYAVSINKIKDAMDKFQLILKDLN